MELSASDPILMPALLFTLILFPFLAAFGAYLAVSDRLLKVIIVVTGVALVTASLVLSAQVPFSFALSPDGPIAFRAVIEVADFALLSLIFYFGWKHRHPTIMALAALQGVLLLYVQFLLSEGQAHWPVFYGDNLALIMIFIISVVGSIICFQALDYMKAHEQHQGLDRSRRSRFFSIMVLFLGAMNGLVLANDMAFFYFFFEVTTLCSFLLIAHDRTPVAVSNALRALWMNCLGGAAFTVAMTGVALHVNSLDLSRLTSAGPADGVLLPALAFLGLAAFTKAAQFPFQSWLLGAMVAPTPVSALLHSSTMVKVGVYLVFRMAPAIRGTFLSHCLAVFGGFGFLAAAALAVGQSNGKKVLAYSTISNLGLMIACAGLNTSAALTAGVLLILFHAVNKALLFLCVGTIEQRIASRDIEDMRGLYTIMPVTALMTVFGVIMMIMPPFGLMLGKWMAMEAAATNLFVIVMVTLGSALTVMYWARWAGILMSDPFAGRFTPERQPWPTWTALGCLCLGGGILSVAAPWLYSLWFTRALSPGYEPPYGVHGGILENAVGAFAVWPLAGVAAVGFVLAVVAVYRAGGARIVKPYVSGLQTDTPGVFTGPLNQPVQARASNYYLSSLFGESRLTVWFNLAAVALLGLILGGAL
ncbi:MAG: proton-conducting transporter membrane subunit [Desulfosoma sp.]